MRTLLFCIFIIFTTASLAVHAQVSLQSNLWGNGSWGATQGCSYPTMTAPTINFGGGTPGTGGGGMNSNTNALTEEVREAQSNVKEIKANIQAKKNERKKAERDLEKARQDIEGNMQSAYASFVINHIESSRNCEDYGINSLPSKRGAESRAQDTGPFKENWASYCQNGAGQVLSSVCTDFKEQGGKSSSALCARALPIYKKQFAETQKISDEITRLERSLEDANDTLKEARKTALQNKSEGGICIECMQNNSGYSSMNQPSQSSNLLGTIGSLGLGLAGMYANYQTTKSIAQYNSNLGYPTQTYGATGFGYPFMNSTNYGTVGSGMGLGGFGCGTTFGSSANNQLFQQQAYQMQLMQLQLQQQQQSAYAQQLQQLQLQQQLQRYNLNSSYGLGGYNYLGNSGLYGLNGLNLYGGLNTTGLYNSGLYGGLTNYSLTSGLSSYPYNYNYTGSSGSYGSSTTGSITGGATNTGVYNYYYPTTTTTTSTGLITGR